MSSKLSISYVAAFLLWQGVALSGELALDGWTVRQMQAAENAGGISFGFWCNYNKLPEVTERFGRRPLDRVGFTSWNSIEPLPGVYDFSSCFNNDITSHQCGSTTIGCINLGSAPATSPSGNTKLWIPDFYTSRIDDPDTRMAAKAALYAYVQERLRVVGRSILLIDYEAMWNYDTSTEAGRTLFSEWFVEAAATARQAAADLGQSDLLEIGLNVNGDPLANPEKVGGTNETWLLTAAAAADVFTIDNYYFDPDAPTSPDYGLSILEFWIKNYSQGKPVLVAENGYQSVLSVDPDYSGKPEKGHGTEEQQAAYFENLFQALETENVPGGKLNGQLRGFCIWSYQDYENEDGMSYYGMIRSDGTEKPACETVASNLCRLAEQTSTAPSTETAGISWNGVQMTNRTELVFSSGTEHGFIRLEGVVPRYARDVNVHIETGQAGCVVAEVNGSGAMLSDGLASTNLDFDISGLIRGGQTNRIDLFFTDAVLPFTQTVTRVSLSCRDDFSDALFDDTGITPLFDFDRSDEAFYAANLKNGASVTQVQWKAAPASDLGLNGVLAAACSLPQTNSQFSLMGSLDGLDVSGVSRLVARVRLGEPATSLRVRMTAKSDSAAAYGTTAVLSSADEWVELEMTAEQLGGAATNLLKLGLIFFQGEGYDGEVYVDLIGADTTGAEDNALPAPPSNAPDFFSASETAAGDILLSWSGPESGVRYEIQRSEVSNGWNTATIFRTQPGTLNWLDETAVAGQTCYYRLSDYNSGGRSEFFEAAPCVAGNRSVREGRLDLLFDFSDSDGEFSKNWGGGTLNGWFLTNGLLAVDFELPSSQAALAVACVLRDSQTGEPGVDLSGQDYQTFVTRVQVESFGAYGGVTVSPKQIVCSGVSDLWNYGTAATLSEAGIWQETYCGAGGVKDLSLVKKSGLLLKADGPFAGRLLIDFMAGERAEPDPPELPSGVTLDVLSGTAVSAAWDFGNPTVSWVLERSADSNDWSRAVMVPAAAIGQMSLTDASLSPLTTYYYRLSGFNSSGSVAGSDVFSARTGNTFLNWSSTRGVPAIAELDNDEDGNPNLMEYFCGTDPLESGPIGVSGKVLTVQGVPSMRVMVPHDPDAMGVDLGIVSTADLQLWADEPSAERTNIAGCVEVLIPLEEDAHSGFYRPVFWLMDD